MGFLFQQQELTEIPPSPAPVTFYPSAPIDHFQVSYDISCHIKAVLSLSKVRTHTCTNTDSTPNPREVMELTSGMLNLIYSIEENVFMLVFIQKRKYTM